MEARCLVVLLCCVGIACASTLRDPFICGKIECAPSSKFKYTSDVTYHYTYQVNANTFFAGASENRSTINIETGIQLEFITPCEGVLKIYNVTIKDQDDLYIQEREKDFETQVSSHHLRFAFHNGVITEICPQEEEENWVLNFKRGILSLFQNSMSRFDIDFGGIEQDIHGTCDTKYFMRGQENTSLIILKTKNLTECTDRYKYLSILQTVQYNFQNKFQPMSVLQSDSTCRITINHNVYTEVSCKEKHLFEPFSAKNSGPITTVTQHLIMTEEAEKTTDEFIEDKSEEMQVIKYRYNLIHNHVPVIKDSSVELRAARDVLKEICRVEDARYAAETNGKNTDDDEESANGALVGLWGNLVRSCRGLHHSALSTLFSRANTICSHGRKYLLDALPYIGSIGSVQMIKNLTMKEKTYESVKNEWLLSTAMIPRPHSEMIESIGEMLAESNLDKTVSLTASSMIHSYCRNSKKNLEDCCKEKQNADIINIFESSIKEVYQNYPEKISRSNREKAIISIKSLGNIGGYNRDFRNFLMSLIEDKDINLAVRIHTVEAFRRVPCAEIRGYFLELFRKTSLDVEIRLASYLQVMRCPKYTTILEIINSLKTEKVNQVSSFVWSHLENLEKSTIPSRVEKQGLLSNNAIPKFRRRPDLRKFSRNYEYGVFFDKYNAGGSIEANIITSPNSYIPRSASLNLTLDMFGESINILEIKGRGEGFESYFEKLFDGSGLFNRSTIMKNLNKFRFARSANEANDVHKKIEDLNYKNEALTHRSPTLDFGVKVFGNEISYWNTEGDEEILETLKEINPLYHINKILAGKNISYKKATMFLDTTYSVPTGCGLSLDLNMMGNSIANLKMSGSINGVENFSQTKKFDFEGKMHPSMAISVAATMSISGGGLVSNGIRVNTHLHTATALSAIFQLESGKGASLKLSLPHSKQEIFEAKSEMIVLHGKKEIKQQGLSKNKIEASTCSWNLVDKAIGIKLCATYEFPNITSAQSSPYFLLAGPTWYLLSLEKVDPTAKVYSFIYSHKSNDSNGFIGFSFDTPGSKTKRMFNSTINYSENFVKAIMNFHSAENHLEAQATYKNQPEHKLLECKLDIDGNKHFDTVVSLTKQEQKNGYVLIPQVYIAVNNERITELVGTLKLTDKKGVSQCDVSLEFQTKKLASRLIGYVNWNGPSKAANLRLDYQFLGDKMETIRAVTLVTNREIGYKKDLYGELELSFTSYPQLNFFTQLKYVGNQNHIDLNYTLSKNRQLTDIVFQFARSKHRTLDGYKENIQIKIIKPYMDINYYYEENGELTLFSTTVAYDKIRHLGGLAGLWGKLYLPVGTKFYMEAGVNATLPSFAPMVLDVHVFEKKQNEFDISIQGMWFTGVDASIVAIYQDFSVPSFSSRLLKAAITSTKFDEITVRAKYLRNNNILNFDIEAIQDMYKYGVIGHYKRFSEYNFSCYGQLDVKSQTYSFNLLADILNDINLSADIHFDTVRDLHIKYHRINKPDIKKINADIAWDVNRDPNQKLSMIIEILNKGTWSHSGSLVLLYPGRSITGEFDILIKDWLCLWLLKFGWAPDQMIQWKLKLYSEMTNETIYGFLSELNTPIEGWKNNNINLIWRYIDNLQTINGNMTWEKQKVSLNLLSNYMFKTNEVFGEFSANIDSTLAMFPTVVASARHHHNWKKTSDTLLVLEYNKIDVMMVNSSWKNDETPSDRNIHGRVSIKTPYQGYKTGLLATKFTFNEKRDIYGITNLHLEDKHYAITIDGHAQRFTNSILQMNITSSDPVYTIMTGKMGLNDVDHHVVAIVKTPNITLGVEFIMNLVSVQNFHIYGHLALPIDFLHNVMVQAKKHPEEIDFRLGFENMTLGFMGIWHYRSRSDFQYLYKLYTPLKGLEDNGLVLKNIYIDGIDSEFSVKLSKHKLGTTILIKENGPGVLNLIESLYSNDSSNNPNINQNEFLADFSTDMFISVDTLFYDTLSLNMASNKITTEAEEGIIKIVGNIIFKNSTQFSLSNKVIMENLSNFTNDFYMKTPFESWSEGKIFTTVDLIIGERYDISSIMQLKNQTEWTKNSINILYEIDEEEENEKKHELIVRLDTQLESLRSVDTRMNYFTDSILTELSAKLKFPSYDMQFKGQYQLDEIYIEASGTFNITSEYFEPRNLHIDFKKDSTDVNMNIKANIHIDNGNQSNYLKTETTYYANSTNYLKMKAKCSLIPIVPPSNVFVALSKDPITFRHGLRMDAKVGSNNMMYTVIAEHDKTFTNISITSPKRGFRKVNFQVEIVNNTKVVGVYKGDTIEYNIMGNITGRNLKEVVAILKPEKNTEPFTFHSIYTIQENGDFDITASLIGSMQFSLRSNLTKLNNSIDFYSELFSANEYFEDIKIKSRLDKLDDGIVKFQLKTSSPFKKLKWFDVNCATQLSTKRGYFTYDFNLTNINGDGNMEWSFYSDDLQIKSLTQHIANDTFKKTYFNLFYNENSNSKGIPIKAGMDLNLDDSWGIGANGSFGSIGLDHTEATLNILLPRPNVDVHSFVIILNAIPDIHERSVEMKYLTDKSKLFSRGAAKLCLPVDAIIANLLLESGDQHHTNLINGDFKALVVEDNTWNVQCNIKTPLYENEETFTMKGTYEPMKNNVIVLRGNLHYPASKQITEIDMNYGGWRYTVGKFNVSTPHENLPWLTTTARFSNNDLSSENLVKITWPDDVAIFNSTSISEKRNSVESQKGIIIAEIPLNTKHVFIGKYDYHKANTWSKGNGTIFYNDQQFVKGDFRSKTERSKDGTRTTVDADVDNTIKPVGIHYVHEYSDDKVTDTKKASIYELNNATNFNLTGQLDIEPWKSGKQVKLKIFQGDKTLGFTNNFEMKDKDIYQGSKFEWNVEKWFQYDIIIQNKTEEDNESHEVKLDMQYPERFLGFKALYHLNESLLDGEATLDWAFESENKTVKLTGEWESSDIQEINNHIIRIALAHPSFKRDVTFNGKYSSDSVTASNLSAVLKYSEFEKDTLTFSSILKDNSNGASRDYKFYINCEHPATELDLKLKSDLKIKYNYYYISNDYFHKKSILNNKIRRGKLFLNLDNHTVNVEREIDKEKYILNGQWITHHPNYKIFYTVDRSEGNDTGSWILSTKDKSIIGHFNRSDDASFHLIGKINDARSAQLNAWRDYEDITTVDVSSYIKLNHSKLLTSKISWRPEMYQQIKNTLSGIIKELYGQTDETLKLIKEVPAETHEALRGVWLDSKPKLKDLLTDLNDVHILKKDIDDFQNFLNDSYTANEFYLKDIVEYVFHAIDETSIKNHLETLPAILSEIWQKMGTTGTSLKDSLQLVIETINSSYAHFMEQINDFLEKDLMDQVSDVIESGILKYDNFIKHMHLEFLSFCETLWLNTINKINQLWKNILSSLEPTYVHLAHYAESYIFQFGTGILDFFYARTEELTETPFFGLLAQFARDVDGLWKDLNNNDAITNFKKYSEIFINFFKTKILIHIPFQKELTEVYTDILEDLNKLQELNIIKIIKSKFWEAKYRLQWWYDYFDIGSGINTIAITMYKKVMEIPKTALQLEESNREAKTNFIFDPNEGLLLLEQKLPMPWYAFNRTPVFSEIPEYKFVRDLVNTFFLSNISLISYYYEFKVYTDIYNLLPPFEGHSVITGEGTIVTFDKEVFTVRESGTYLLVSDFLTNNFSILIQSDGPKQFNILLLTKNDMITINLNEQSVSTSKNKYQYLPINIDDWDIKKDEDHIIIDNTQGIKINCYLVLNTCTFTVKGTYFSILGGLMGNMNNEQYDDIQTTKGEITSYDNFINSWKLYNTDYIKEDVEQISNMSVCENYFKNNVSPLKECFTQIDVSPFYDECVEGMDPCMLAKAYYELCFYNHIPTVIPSKCMECKTPVGTIIEQGTFGEVTESVNSTDIVFIVEIHECNKQIKIDKNIDKLISTLDSKLSERGFSENRYTVVGFGNQGIYKTAQSVYVENKLFVNAKEATYLFDHLFDHMSKDENNLGNHPDMFDALSKASNLNFRPGVSKIFILFPCTKCDVGQFRLDYPVIHQVLTDSSITLHIVANDEFRIERRKRLQNIVYGIDSKYAFTSKDAKSFSGDVNTRKFVKYPKSTLGFCASLVMETNGTLFMGNKMSSLKKDSLKVIEVFSHRASLTPTPFLQTRCECHAARLRCTVRPRQLSPYVNEEFNWENSELDYIDNFFDAPVNKLWG